MDSRFTASSCLHVDLFRTDLSEFRVHLVQVAIYELSTQTVPHLWFVL